MCIKGKRKQSLIQKITTGSQYHGKILRFFLYIKKIKNKKMNQGSGIEVAMDIQSQ
jgi:hypothetical protein